MSDSRDKLGGSLSGGTFVEGSDEHVFAASMHREGEVAELAVAKLGS